MTSFGAIHLKFGVSECCRLDLFSRSTKYSLQEFLDVKNNFPRQVCCFWAKTMHERWEKWNVSETRWSVWGDSLLQRLSNIMFGDKTPQVCHPIRKYMFFFVSCPRLNATDGNKRFQKCPHSCGRGLKIGFPQLHIYNFLGGAKHYYLKGNTSL